MDFSPSKQIPRKNIIINIYGETKVRSKVGDWRIVFSRGSEHELDIPFNKSNNYTNLFPVRVTWFNPKTNEERLINPDLAGFFLKQYAKYVEICPPEAVKAELPIEMSPEIEVPIEVPIETPIQKKRGRPPKVLVENYRDSDISDSNKEIR